MPIYTFFISHLILVFFFSSMNSCILDHPTFIWFSVVIMNLSYEEYYDTQKYFLVAK